MGGQAAGRVLGRGQGTAWEGGEQALSCSFVVVARLDANTAHQSFRTRACGRPSRPLAISESCICAFGGTAPAGHIKMGQWAAIITSSSKRVCHSSLETGSSKWSHSAPVNASSKVYKVLLGTLRLAPGPHPQVAAGRGGR